MLKNIYTKVISLEKHFVKDTPYKLWQFATSLKPEAIFTKAFHIPFTQAIVTWIIKSVYTRLETVHYITEQSESCLSRNENSYE